ncbi:hypothetical protein HGRIS_010907 [Hohenbuehelia grisea]|uniref:Uncharacterized protein n=1 Tax=Hohenbuehelia grisea TaxID=104357 RepID=A0ABR3IYJ7_9AGAR
MTSEASSSTSTTPMILTPDSTGVSDNAQASLTALKKSRRQTAFYPNINSTNKPQKPFSRSAAKRESVMALGSIEHLQHYFTKTGIAAKQSASDKPRHGLVPAIGGLANISTESPGNPEFNLPPSPAIPSAPQPQFVPHVKGYEADPESLLPGVVHDLSAVADAWDLPRTGSRSTPNGPIDILHTLKLTTKAIRSIRNYSVSLPDESPSMLRAPFRPRTLGPGKSRPPVRPKAQPGQEDPLTTIRTHALEVLGILRELEERARVPLSDEAYDAHSDSGGSASHVASPSSSSNGLPPVTTNPNSNLLTAEPEGDLDASVSFSLVQVHGRYESVPVWEDEDEKFLDNDDEGQKREGWDERLVLGSGWLYRQDITLGDLVKEREAVGRYLDTVDDGLFRRPKELEEDEGDGGGRSSRPRERGWEQQARQFDKRVRSRSKGRRVSSGDGEGRGLGLMVAENGMGRRRVSTGMVGALDGMSLSEDVREVPSIAEAIEEGEESLEDEELPRWARRNEFAESELDRAHALLSAFLPSTLVASLAPSSSRSDFLQSLSSGQLLCIAYNACVRKSRFPWGYIDKDAIHDIFALQRADAAGDEARKAESKTGWTFRRSDNLVLWGGALKIRYLLPMHIPLRKDNSGGQPQSPRGSRFQEPKEPPILFDTKLIARREVGWEDMLETALLRWVSKVVEERRHAA